MKLIPITLLSPLMLAMLTEYPDQESSGIRQVLKNGHSLEFQWGGTEDSSTEYILPLQPSIIAVDF